MLCFAYDLDEYEEKRGLDLDLEKDMPCPVDQDEDTLLKRIQTLDYAEYSAKTAAFHNRFVPYVGGGSAAVVDAIEEKLQQ